MPAFRLDVDGFADIAEESLRLYGYDALPSTLPFGEISAGGRSTRMRLSDGVKRALAAQGAHEVFSFAFISPQSVEKLRLPKEDRRNAPVVIRNPLGEDTSVMRTTLVPNMLETLSRNISRKNDPAMLFECGAVFDGTSQNRDGLPVETQALCVGAHGTGHDFYQLRDVVMELLRTQGVVVEIAAGGDAYFHPGRCARIMVEDETAAMGEDQTIAAVGEIHPEVAAAFDIEPRVYIAEVNLTLLQKLAKPIGKMRPISRYPAVSRDLALVVDDAQAVGPMVAAIRQAGGELLETVGVFDVYRSEQLGFGKKSVAFSMRFRADDRTLTDEEVTALFARAAEGCKARFGAAIRE